jgi:hypothetical protein
MASLPADLLRPDAYPPPTPRSVELRESHSSWVFLTDTEAYKVKKPVDFGFLDFRTVEQRRAACEAEALLDGRLAPGVCRGVVPVRVKADGRLVLGGGRGEIVDWAVRMERMPDQRRADAMLARGDLSASMVAAIAARLAAFHAGARSDADTAHFGSVAVIGQNVRENFARMRGSITRFLTPAEAVEIEAWQLSVLCCAKSTFLSRVHAGRIRDGHGDLRLEQIYLLPDGEMKILDCVEFNDRFRFGDACSDVAFLSMDLALAGRVDLAELLLARYAREADDYELYALVDFYESYRAYVRGKVSTMLADDESASDEARQEASEQARRCFLLSLAAGRKAVLTPAVVAVGGMLAAGKSTVADRLGLALCAPVIDAERTRKRMLGISPSTTVRQDTWKGAYDPDFNERVYAELFRRAAVVLESGRSVVLDASFRSCELRRKARDLARQHGVAFQFVECTADASARGARLREREREYGVSDGRLAVFDAFLGAWEPTAELTSQDLVIVDTSQALAQTMYSVHQRIPSYPRPGAMLHRV